MLSVNVTGAPRDQYKQKLDLTEQMSSGEKNPQHLFNGASQQKHQTGTAASHSLLPHWLPQSCVSSRGNKGEQTRASTWKQ